MLLGIDIGTSFIKASVIESFTGAVLASTQYPSAERAIHTLRHGWAEQPPMQWWEDVKMAILALHATRKYYPSAITAIGITYQMHGLVMVDKDQNVLRESIIWCDSRAVDNGNRAFAAIGEGKCLSQLLNSPGNFTAAKLAWVKENEPQLFEKIDKIMLPGDFIAMKLTGNITTSIAALSEGIFWDFKNQQLSEDVFNYFGFSKDIIPPIVNVFAEHGYLSDEIAKELSLTPKIPVTYKAGDQPNNALSLNVLQPGEVAATAGTSGVIYAVSDQLVSDKQSRINTFAHVNHTAENTRTGVLLCINGTGSMNRWTKSLFNNEMSYRQMNDRAAGISAGSEGLLCFPFGNGAERIFNNKLVNAHFNNIDLNLHGPGHICRAVQEGIAYAFRYGLDIMRENGINPSVVKAGNANMFLSNVFTQAFVNTTGVPVELYEMDGSIGAAIGAGIGSGIYKNEKEAFTNFRSIKKINPGPEKELYNGLYERWKERLMQYLE